jgi:peptidoglycan/LPS O-acetylase OafA/YrhL
VGRYSYAAFLVHPIVCVGVQSAAEGWRAGCVLKTVVCGTLGVARSWAVAWSLVRVPGVEKVLL